MKKQHAAAGLKQIIEGGFMPVLQVLAESSVSSLRDVSHVLEMAQLLSDGLAELATGKPWGLYEIQKLEEKAKRIAGELYLYRCHVADQY